MLRSDSFSGAKIKKTGTSCVEHLFSFILLVKI